ncbi:unnamed protein product [Heligmosomoides polygyrus]|uniref:Uncharacterized protein n=1 Tax=Heligmosomoides polygyrus TaxID=6339 RepID=A0A183FBN3_HELPZ|nr:unnamed protein product [Heligmosomoides polygyrus]
MIFSMVLLEEVTVHAISSVKKRTAPGPDREDLKERRAEVLAEAAEPDLSIRNARRNFANFNTKMTALRPLSTESNAFFQVFGSDPVGPGCCSLLHRRDGVSDLGRENRGNDVSILRKMAWGQVDHGSWLSKRSE